MHSNHDHETTELTFRIGDLFIAGNERDELLVSIAAAMNDLIFAFRLYSDRHDLSDKGETQYLVRTSSSHLLELAQLLSASASVMAMRPLLDSLSPERASDLARVASVADGKSEFSRVLFHMRNKATWHYPRPGDRHLRRAMADATDMEGTITFGDSVATIRNGFADIIVTQFWLHLLDDEDKLAALASFYRELADVTATAVSLAEELLFHHVQQRGARASSG